ncbi:MAG: DUF6445 family protein [Tateyamaria sp.]
MPDFTISPELRIDVAPIGQSGEPMFIIDSFLTHPEDLVKAASTAEWKDLPPGGYPGRRAGLPRAYAHSVLRRLDGAIRKKLITTPAKLGKFTCSFSMVTQRPDDLHALQRVPHIDVANPYRVAILHYLCDTAFGGTAFFRQDATGFEQIGPQERPAFLQARQSDISKLTEADTYPSEDTPGYTRTGFVAAQFNRLVAYRGFTLHSGIIDQPEMLSSDPAKGRLTANFFVDYEPLY